MDRRMTKSPFAIVAAAAALIALFGCETTNQAGEAAVAQSSDSIQWNTPRQSEGPTTVQPVQPAPPAQPTQPVESGQPMPPAASPEPQPVPQATQSGPECREFQHTVTIGGKPAKVYGRACRQPDGTWKQVGMAQPTPPVTAQPVEQSFPYGWYGYDYPSGPRYGPGGASIGVGAGSHGGGGFIGTGIGVGF
jgi:hypothetical protein